VSFRRNFPTAGGHAVHRVRSSKPVGDEDSTPDGVPFVERYQDLARLMHKTVMVPRGDRYVVGCLCGWFTLSHANVGSAGAGLLGWTHVLEKAAEMMNTLEPKPLDAAEIA
jgi:hypothetical protein